MSKFVKVAKVADLEPYTALPVNIDGREIAIIFTQNQYYALDGICTHAHCLIAYGWVEDGSIWCGCHGAEYDVRTGAPKDLIATRPLPTYPVRVDGNDIYVALQ